MASTADDVIKGSSRIRVPPLLSPRSASSLDKTRVVELRFHTSSATCLAEEMEDFFVLRERTLSDAYVFGRYYCADRCVNAVTL